MFVNVKLFKIKSLKKKKKRQDTRPVQVPGQGKQSASLDGKRHVYNGGEVLMVVISENHLSQAL